MGKASLIMVLGLSFVLAVIRVSITSRATDATTNFLRYLSWAQSYSLRTTGLEVALGRFDRLQWVTAGVLLNDSVKVNSQTYNYRVVLVRPRTDTAAIYSLVSYYDRDARRSYSQYSCVELQNQSFSRYAYFTDNETGFSGTSRIYWMTKDTMGYQSYPDNGNLHTNDALSVSGEPCFWGRVTTWGGIYKNPSSSDPHFYGGHEDGVHIDLPLSFEEAIANMGSGSYIKNNTDLYINLQANGTMKVKTSPSGTETTLKVDSVASSGLIVANGGNIHIKGTVGTTTSGTDLRLTIVALNKSGSGGNVYIDDNIVYNHQGTYPYSDPYNGNLLGLCADNNVIVTNNTANNSDGVDIMGTMMARTGSFYAEDWDSRHVSGDNSIRMWGGVIQDTRGAVGTFSGSSIVTGFKKHYTFDPRLRRTRPPFFPMTPIFHITQWWE